MTEEQPTGSVWSDCYSASYTSRDQTRFTVPEVAADCHQLMICHSALCGHSLPTSHQRLDLRFAAIADIPPFHSKSLPRSLQATLPFHGGQEAESRLSIGQQLAQACLQMRESTEIVLLHRETELCRYQLTACDKRASQQISTTPA